MASGAKAKAGKSGTTTFELFRRGETPPRMLLMIRLVLVGRRLVALLNLDTDNAYITLALEKLGLVSNTMIVGISIGGFAYAVLNLVEAYGLHRRLRWAEWLTVVATGLLIPFEVYEVVHRLSPVRVGALVLNVAIVIYLAKHKELFPRWF